jgi:predicted membrane channel-forming protein YqfA (hemolysin III family)
MNWWQVILICLGCMAYVGIAALSAQIRSGDWWDVFYVGLWPLALLWLAACVIRWHCQKWHFDKGSSNDVRLR